MTRIRSLATHPDPTAPLERADEKGIEEAMARYLLAGRLGDSSIMKPAFHENARMSGSDENGAFSGPIQALYDHVDRSGPAIELEAHIVDVTMSDERAASVVLRADHWHGRSYIDHFHMLRVGGTWKILSKIFSQA